MRGTRLAIAGVVLAAVASTASAQVAPRTYFTKRCDPTDCVVRSTTTDYVPAGPTTVWTPIATLRLPYGTYFATGKVGGWSSVNGWWTVECQLVGADGTSDTSSASLSVYTPQGGQYVFGQTALHMQLPVYVTSRAGGTVTMQCRVLGQSYQVTDPPTFSEMHLWGASIAATPVSGVSVQ